MIYLQLLLLILGFVGTYCSQRAIYHLQSTLSDVLEKPMKIGSSGVFLFRQPRHVETGLHTRRPVFPTAQLSPESSSYNSNLMKHRRYTRSPMYEAILELRGPHSSMERIPLNNAHYRYPRHAQYIIHGVRPVIRDHLERVTKVLHLPDGSTTTIQVPQQFHFS